MNVRLVALTQPFAEYANEPPMTPEELIVYTARVSSPQNQTAVETAPRLLRYLIKHGHWSPFEMVDMTVEVETSRAVAAQLLRHRSFSFQEFSQRYSAASLGFEFAGARRQDPTNRQNSIDDLTPEVKDWWESAQDAVFAHAEQIYADAIEAGVAKEVARMVLPLATRTRLYMKGSVRSWIHYLGARTDPATQKEHRDVANRVRQIFNEQFPNVARALEEA